MREKVFGFGPGASLVGICSEPVDRDAAKGRPAMLFANTGISHRVGPFRLNVELARRVAAMGFYGFRFDFSGLGDSRSAGDDRDDYTRAIDEARLAMDLMTKRTGVDRFVWFGLCSSADKGHHIALKDPRIVGAVFIDGYANPTAGFKIRHWLRYFQWKRIKVGIRTKLAKLREAMAGAKAETPPPYKAIIASPAPEKIGGELKTLADRGVEQLHLFTISTDYVYNYEGQFWDLYPMLRGHERVQTERYPEADHTLSFRGLQLLFIDRVCRWMERF